jgi:hypothetical protein
MANIEWNYGQYRKELIEQSEFNKGSSYFKQPNHERSNEPCY